MSTRPTELNHNIILATLRDYVEQLLEEGLEGLPISPTSFYREPSPHPAAAPSESGDTKTRPPIAAASETSEARATLSAPGAAGALFSIYPGLEKTAKLADLRAFIGDCCRCRLAESRTHLVFGVGDPNARLMFVGEGPGADEDAQGEPFVGRAGQLLTDIIERGMGMSRAEVYICNVVKCRPPENRKPEPAEIAACEPFLWRQIELVKPQVIVALGSVAAQALLGVKTPISRLRGAWHQARGIRVMPTFHPAYLLRNPADKRLVWSDVQQVMKVLGLPAAKRGRSG